MPIYDHSLSVYDEYLTELYRRGDSFFNSKPSAPLTYDDLKALVAKFPVSNPKLMFTQFDEFDYPVVRNALAFLLNEKKWQFWVGSWYELVSTNKPVLLSDGHDKLIVQRLILIPQRMEFVELYKQGKIGRRFLRYLIGQSAHATVSRQTLARILAELESDTSNG